MRNKLIALFVTVAAAGAVLVAPALAASTAKVKISDNKFTAKKLTVKPGTKVTWTWSGSHPHNVTAVSVPKGAKKFASNTLTGKGTFSQALTKPGTYKLECTIHVASGMTMTITVKK